MSALSRPLRLLLLASLALNIALGVALIARAPWTGTRHGPHHAAPLPGLVDLRALRQHLSPGREDVVDAAFAAHRDALRPRLMQLFEARREVRAAIRAEPFERATLDAAFARLRQAETEVASEAQALLGDLLEGATPQERERIAELMPRRGSAAHGRTGARDARGAPPAGPEAAPPRR